MAARIAIEERPARVPRQNDDHVKDELRAIVDRMRALPVLGDRSPDEIVGYDERGLPT